MFEIDEHGNKLYTIDDGAKLTPSKVQEIRKKLTTISQKMLAKEYGVSRPTITRIANNKTWRI